MPYLWKAMKAGLRSGYDGSQWEIGKWRKVDGKVKFYSNGFHASENIIDAMKYTDMEVLAKVEVRGEIEINDNKQAWTEMRVVKAWEWKKEDSVALTIYATKLVIDNFERKYSDDKRPRQAINAARAWLKNPTEENKLAAWAAKSAAESAIWAAESVAWAAESVAGAAWSAAWAARSAAESVAWVVESVAEPTRAAAWSAAWAAKPAVWTAAYQEILAKCHRWVVRRIRRLTPIERKDEK